MELNKIYNADVFDFIKSIEDNSIDLIITSPPYANQRKKQYGGISPDEYVEWWMPISKELNRVLSTNGSFILNIKENVVDGEKHPYVMELVLKMRKEGWKLIDQYIWHKKNSMPGKYKNRMRDGWEHLFHFSKTLDISFYPERVKIPIGDWSKKRLNNLGKNDIIDYKTATNSGFGRNLSNWVGKDTVLPDNVLYLSCETTNKEHPAVFPEKIPEFFIKLLSKENDIVFDPFTGSGTTLSVAKLLSRRYLGCEISNDYLNIAEKRINKTSGLFE